MIFKHPRSTGRRHDLVLEPSWIEHRHERRIAISIGLSVRERHGRARPVELLDLSRRGCCVGDSSLKAGQKIWVTLHGLVAIEGIVSWCHKGKAGIRFGIPLHQAVLDHLVSTHESRSSHL
ncbi:PilZ domain-containing protein [Sphingomonas glacialis]|uniref:PilZ domain-containing protein n=1 Tax=Sphingomonas glacialis TaxID=658225 RepID=UPI001679B832